jgi:pimeloyl-ACP methyl ester carboxylesterase
MEVRRVEHNAAAVLGGPINAHIARSCHGETIRAWRRPPCRPGGACVAMVHGLEGTWGSWTELVDQLTPECDVYLLDLPWRAGGGYAWQHWGSSSTWLARGMDLVPVPPDIVIAHSFGASTLLDLLARERRPSTRQSNAPSTTPVTASGRRRARPWSGSRRPAATVQGAVLIAPLFRPADAAVDPGFFSEAVTRFRTVMSDGLLTQLGDRAVALAPDRLRLMLDTVLRRVEPSGFLQLYTLLSRLPALPLETIDAPVLIVSGVHDPSAPPPAAQELADRLPAGQLAQRPEFGHFCQIKHATEVAELVNKFLTDVRADPARHCTPSKPDNQEEATAHARNV